MGILLQPTWWTDGSVSPPAAWQDDTVGGATRPPFAWETLQGDRRFYFKSIGSGGIAANPANTYIGNCVYGVTCMPGTPAVFQIQFSTAVPMPVALANGVTVVLEASAGGSIPDGFSANTVYYMVNVDTGTNLFELSASPGGSAIDATTAGAGLSGRVPPSNAGRNNEGELFGTVRFAYQIIAATDDSSTLQFWYRTGSGLQSLSYGDGTTQTVNLTSTVGATGVVSVPIGLATELVWGITATNDIGHGAEVAIGEGLTDSTYGNVIYNGTGPDPEDYPTLAQLRTRLLIRTGFATTASNPPPGVALLFNDFLFNAQKRIYLRYPTLPTRHFFKWDMSTGQRMYGLKDNTDDIYKAYTLMFRKGVQWAGIRDDRGTWTPIVNGIDPSLYTMVTQYGRPVKYEVRDVIEVFPAPDDHYELWLLGQRNLEPFIADSDQTTIDGELVFMTALGVAKTHYGQPDAQSCVQAADLYLGELVAATHLSKRYIPGSVPILPVVKPQLIQFLGGSGNPGGQ
jgi:hypothetical protein